MVAPLTCALLAFALVVSGCGEDDFEPPEAIPIGTSPAHHLPPLSPAVRNAEPVGEMTCERSDDARRYGVHLELFGGRQSAIIPVGIGIAPPHRGRRPYVESGRCSYPIRTREPTGVIEIAPSPAAPTLGDFFELWGQPLTRTRAGGFRGPVRLWLDGREWNDDPRALPLGRHAQVVVVVGPSVPVHDDYVFPPGL